MQRHVELNIPIFKVGSDMAGHLKDSASVVDALTKYASQLQAAAKIVEEAAIVLKDQEPSEIEMEADTHYVGIFLPQTVAELLTSRGLADYSVGDLDEMAALAEAAEETEAGLPWPGNAEQEMPFDIVLDSATEYVWRGTMKSCGTDPKDLEFAIKLPLKVASRTAEELYEIVNKLFPVNTERMRAMLLAMEQCGDIKLRRDGKYTLPN